MTQVLFIETREREEGFFILFVRKLYGIYRFA